MPYDCQKCGKNFKRKEHLNYHLNKKKSCDEKNGISTKNDSTINNDDNNLENIIKKIIDDSNDIDNSDQNYLNDPNDQKVTEYMNHCKCAYCDKEFSRKDSVVYHIKHNCKKVKEKKREKQNMLEKIKKDDLKIKELEENIEKLKEDNQQIMETLRNKENKEEKLEIEITELKKYVLDLEKKINLNNTNADSNDDKNFKKKVKIPQSMRLMVWEKHIGLENGKGKCKCCEKKEITQIDFECGHIIAETNGGKTQMDNLLPICTLCNRSMRTENLFVYQTKLKNFTNGGKI